ncbi:T-cell surface glycoprotein CD8 alpha chain isoform 1-T1 [Ara ararauna]
MVLPLHLTSWTRNEVCLERTWLFPSGSHKDSSPTGCPGIRGQGYMMKIHSITQPRMGQQLMLYCESSNMDSGIFWVRQDKAGTLHFIVFISSLSRTTFGGNMRTSKHFEVWKDRRFCWLAVKSFKPQDEGNYFCLMNINQALYFSPGQPLFLPVTTTVAPKTLPSPTTPAPNITERDPCLRTPDSETSKEKGLDFLCDIFIWVPLTATCFLLLLALAVTIMLCQQTRRRRCRCKRPAKGKPSVKRGTPGPHA